MLVIRSEQVKVLEQVLRQQFERRMTDSMRHHFPEELGPADDDELRPRVSAAISAAEEFGVEDEESIKDYIWYYFALAPGFPSAKEYQWAHDILTSKEIADEQKMTYIEYYYLLNVEPPEEIFLDK
jgi:hypothetical protein